MLFRQPFKKSCYNHLCILSSLIMLFKQGNLSLDLIACIIWHSIHNTSYNTSDHKAWKKLGVFWQVLDDSSTAKDFVTIFHFLFLGEFLSIYLWWWKSQTSKIMFSKCNSESCYVRLLTFPWACWKGIQMCINLGIHNNLRVPSPI